MDEKIKVLDLYSGLGGFTSGFEDSLFDVTHVDNCSMKGVHGHNVDFKMNCNKFLRKHKQKRYNIVLGGPPCKISLSVALHLCFFHFKLF